jgi:hypothetical protein
VLCAIAPGAPIGGCDPPHPASIAAATQLVSAQQAKSEILITCLLKPERIGG